MGRNIRGGITTIWSSWFHPRPEDCSEHASEAIFQADYSQDCFHNEKLTDNPTQLAATAWAWNVLRKEEEKSSVLMEYLDSKRMLKNLQGMLFSSMNMTIHPDIDILGTLRKDYLLDDIAKIKKTKTLFVPNGPTLSCYESFTDYALDLFHKCLFDPRRFKPVVRKSFLKEMSMFTKHSDLVPLEA